MRTSNGLNPGLLRGLLKTTGKTVVWSGLLASCFPCFAADGRPTEARVTRSALQWQPRRAVERIAVDLSDSPIEEAAEGKQVGYESKGCGWESGLKWRVKAPTEFATAREISPMPERHSFIRTVSHTAAAKAVRDAESDGNRRAVDPFDEPFGDRSSSETDARDESVLNAPQTLVARRAEAQKPAAAPRPIAYRDDRASRLNDLRATNERDCVAAIGKCTDARKRLRSESIADISVDITPAYKTDPKNVEEAQAELEKLYNNRDFKEHTFKDRAGNIVAHGKLKNYLRGKIVVTREDGTDTLIPYRDLSDEDMCFLSAWWRLPTECTLGGEPLLARNWNPSTMTWKASALCHKPLYFEETQLERYGHTTGPLSQPILSSAHFFTNIAVLPYKMGINPLNECQYALGYYRPGSCAPWLLPPIPISVRGALAEAGTVIAGVAVLP
ncbi:MAG: hypothetical protein FJ295_12115 [Planctomycetes bacterium]|nr:hypothetical protein [Planctomycetota bacterium]